MSWVSKVRAVTNGAKLEVIHADRHACGVAIDAKDGAICIDDKNYNTIGWFLPVDGDTSRAAHARVCEALGLASDLINPASDDE